MVSKYGSKCKKDNHLLNRAAHQWRVDLHFFSIIKNCNHCKNPRSIDAVGNVSSRLGDLLLSVAGKDFGGYMNKESVPGLVTKFVLLNNEIKFAVNSF